MRMDHHCPWTGNCVGLKTHKFFYCFLIWTILACLHVAISTPLLCNYLSYNFAKIDNDFVQKHKYLNPFYAMMASLSVPIGVGVLLCLHRFYLARNETSIEFTELNMYGNIYRKDPFSNKA